MENGECYAAGWCAAYSQLSTLHSRFLPVSYTHLDVYQRQIHDGGTGTAEAGHCLEEGIGDTWNIPAYIIGQHAKKGESNPGYTDNHISIAAVE